MGKKNKFKKIINIKKMTWLKRIGLFILTNILVIALITVITRVFGIDTQYLTPNGIDLQALAIMSLLWGMVGSVISLFLSKWSAKRAFKIKIIKTPNTIHEKIVYQTVQKISQSEGIKVPEVGIFHSPSPNAFATGATKNSSLVAVSTGLLEAMDSDEIEAVVGHEMAHILNGDMVTMTLLQGVMNAFVIFFARIIASIISNALSDRDGGLGRGVETLIILVMQFALGILASLVVNAFSRHREFHADAGSAKYLGRNKMIKALQKLESFHRSGPVARNKNFATMGISGSFKSWFSTHPPLSKRIEALKALH